MPYLFMPMKRNLVKKIKEGVIESSLFLAAFSSVFITISIVVVLSYD
jgi:hypothetical protein